MPIAFHVFLAFFCTIATDIATNLPKANPPLTHRYIVPLLNFSCNMVKKIHTLRGCDTTAKKDVFTDIPFNNYLSFFCSRIEFSVVAVAGTKTNIAVIIGINQAVKRLFISIVKSNIQLLFYTIKKVTLVQ